MLVQMLVTNEHHIKMDGKYCKVYELAPKNCAEMLLKEKI